MSERQVYVPNGGGFGAALKERKRITERFSGQRPEPTARRRARLRRIREGGRA